MHALVCVPSAWMGWWHLQLRPCLACPAKLHCVLASRFVPSVAGHQPPSELAAVHIHSWLLGVATQPAWHAVGAQQVAGRLARPLQPQTAVLDARRVAGGARASQEAAVESAASVVGEATRRAWLHAASGHQYDAPAHPSIPESPNIWHAGVA